jgi:hypothetical protein
MRNRPLLGNGSANTHFRGKGYADYKRRTVQVCVVCGTHRVIQEYVIHSQRVSRTVKEIRDKRSCTAQSGISERFVIEIRKTDVDQKEFNV